MSRLGPERLLTLVGYSSVLPKNHWPEELNQSPDLPQNYWLTPDRAPSFNVCFVSVIESFRRLYMYLYVAKNSVKNITKELIQNLWDR